MATRIVVSDRDETHLSCGECYAPRDARDATAAEVSRLRGRGWECRCESCDAVLIPGD